MRRILHVGLGPLGRMIVADVVSRGAGRVVAAVDTDPALSGVQLGELVPSLRDTPGHPEATLRVTGSLEAAAGTGCDCAIVSTSSDLARCAPTIRELVSRGVSVVSTCEELLYPWLRHPVLAEELHALCVHHGARLLGTGVNPGFLMDTLPVAATAVCRGVRSVHAWRIQDATTRRVPFQQKIGAGLDDREFAKKVREGTLRHVGLGESLHFIAKYLGLRVDDWHETIEPVRAERDLDCAVGHIARGRAAGVRQVAVGLARGEDGDQRATVTLEFQAAIGQPDPHDRVAIEAEPSLDLVIKGGVHGDIATTSITVNAIGSMLSAAPGLHTMATIPLVRSAV
jgi:4-hydroxy-tetrahydrodipicolinate reductase